MSTTPRFRQVNQVLDAKPRIGPFPADLVFPWAGIALAIFVITNYLLKLDWLWTILLISWGCATWWILVGSKPHRFLSKFVGVPQWRRGYVQHQAIRDYQQLTSHRRSLTQSRKSTHRHKPIPKNHERSS
jgi:hypothetical protein